jgi:hypothetical protein
MRTRSVVGAVALAGGVGALVLLARRGAPPAPAAPADPRLTDVRVAELLEPCVHGGFYDKAVSDVVPILIEKLQRGGGEPLKRAKEELGAAGEEGGRALARLFDQYFSDPMTDAYLENALDAASLNPGDEAHGLLLRALSHPRESVRQRAMTGFVSGRARREDFDVFLERLRGADTRQLRALYARALFVADRERAELETLRWMREKRNDDVWNDFARELAHARSPEAAALARGIYATLDPFLGVWVAVPAAVGGDEAALAFLREERERPDPRRRLAAVSITAPTPVSCPSGVSMVSLSSPFRPTKPAGPTMAICGPGSRPARYHITPPPTSAITIRKSNRRRRRRMPKMIRPSALCLLPCHRRLVLCVSVADQGSSGQGCFGYRPRSSLRTSG